MKIFDLKRVRIVPTAMFAALVLAFFMPAHPAFAATVTMGEVFCNVADNLYPFIDVFNWIAYCTGAVFVIQGILHLKNHQEDPRQFPHHKTFALLAAGAMLGALPSFAGMLISSLFGFGGVGTDTGMLGACAASKSTVVAGNTQGSAVGLDQMLTNFITNIQYPLEIMISIIAIAMGVFMIVRGLIKAAKYGNDPRTHSITHILTNLIIGAALLAISDNITMIMASIMGNNGGIVSFNSLGWTALNTLGDVSRFKVAIHAALTFFQLVGLISFVRGWHVIRNSIEGVGQATFAQGLTHIVGGVLAMNIYLFMQMVDATIGTQFVT